MELGDGGYVTVCGLRSGAGGGGGQILSILRGRGTQISTAKNEKPSPPVVMFSEQSLSKTVIHTENVFSLAPK